MVQSQSDFDRIAMRNGAVVVTGEMGRRDRIRSVNVDRAVFQLLSVLGNVRTDGFSAGWLFRRQ